MSGKWGIAPLRKRNRRAFEIVEKGITATDALFWFLAIFYAPTRFLLV